MLRGSRIDYSGPDLPICANRGVLKISSCNVPDSLSMQFGRRVVPVVVVVVTRSDQPKPPAVAIVRQNGLSSASCRASVAVTPVSRQIWWIQVVGGRPLARLHSCEGRSPSLVLVQIRRIRFAGTSLRSMVVAKNWQFTVDLLHGGRAKFRVVNLPIAPRLRRLRTVC